MSQCWKWHQSDIKQMDQTSVWYCSTILCDIRIQCWHDVISSDSTLLDHNQNQNPCHPQPNVAQSPEIIRSTLTFANLCIRWERSQARTSIHTDTHRQTRSRTHASYPEPNQSTIYTHTHLNPTPTQCTSALARTHLGACTHSHVHCIGPINNPHTYTRKHKQSTGQSPSEKYRIPAFSHNQNTSVHMHSLTHEHTNILTHAPTHAQRAAWDIRARRMFAHAPCLMFAFVIRPSLSLLSLHLIPSLSNTIRKQNLDQMETIC